MPSWLAPALVAVFAAFALAATLTAWRLRQATPRRLSLALSLVACVTITATAFDLSIPLPAALCVRRFTPNDGDLEAQIAAELESWTWSWRPCRRLELDVSPEQLGDPIDFSRLAALAAARSIAVDVAPANAVPLRGERLALLWNEQRPAVPIASPVPASEIDRLRPILSEHADTPLDCGIDRPQGFGSIHEILQAQDPHSPIQGFYPLACRPPGSVDAPLHRAYIHVSPDSVVVASSSTGRPVKFDDSPKLGLPPSVSTVSEDHPSVSTATMLMLDRPQNPETCDRVRPLLERGATVVIAMPGDEFVAHCAWLPVEPRQTENHHNITFDRRPRLTYILDDFADDLPLPPSWVFHPNRPGALGEPQKWALSRALMIDEAVSSCNEALRNDFKDPNCDRPAALRSISDEWVPALRLSRENSARDIVDEERLEGDVRRINRSAAARSLSELAAARDSFPTRWENELVVVFTYDSRPPDRELMRSFLETGSRVQIARIKDPYGESLKHHAAPVTSASPAATPLLLKPDGLQRWTGGSDPQCGTGELDRCIPPLSLSSPSEEPQTSAELRPLVGRFRQEEKPIMNAPVRFGWWNIKNRPGAPFPAQVANTTGDTGLIERPLAVGTMVGRGHLLFLGYSPLELEETSTTSWLKAPTMQGVLGGMSPVRELFAATEPFLTRLAGPVLAVDLQPDGAVRVTVVETEATNKKQVHDRMEFVHGDIRIAAPLVDFHTTRRELVYALPARELAEKLTRCTPLQAEVLGQHDPIHVCPPPSAEASRRGLDPVTSLHLLARYSGGSDDPATASPDRDVLHFRALGLGGLSLIFLVAWSRRATRRLRGRSVRRRLIHHEQQAARRYDPPDAIVAAGGDWDGRSSTWPRTGSFGGFRALEAGDRPSAIVLQDLVLPTLGGPRLLPRVSQRIEEAGPSVAVLVNLGATMRAPGKAEDIKAMFAGLVAAHLAAAAWKIRAEVEIQAVGIRGQRDILEPTGLNPGHEELLENLRARLRQPVADDAAWTEDLPECGAVVYVSDFQLEDDLDLQRWLTRLEGQGIRAGGVLLYSATEFTMIEGGRLAGSGVWADRADWDADDVFEAFGRRRDRIEQIFDATTTGGLVVIGTHFSQDDIEGALASGRLLQILR